MMSLHLNNSKLRWAERLRYIQSKPHASYYLINFLKRFQDNERKRRNLFLMSYKQKANKQSCTQNLTHSVHRLRFAVFICANSSHKCLLDHHYHQPLRLLTSLQGLSSHGEARLHSHSHCRPWQTHRKASLISSSLSVSSVFPAIIVRHSGEPIAL